MEFTDKNFKELVLESQTLAVVDFWAPWCGPCKTISPVIEKIADQNNQIVIGKLNIDENPTTTIEFGIRNIPTILFIKNGEIVGKHVGTIDKNGLEQKIQQYI